MKIKKNKKGNSNYEKSNSDAAGFDVFCMYFIVYLRLSKPGNRAYCRASRHAPLRLQHRSPITERNLRKMKCYKIQLDSYKYR